MEVKYSVTLNEKGLFATKNYLKNDIVLILSGDTYSYPTRETIYVSNNLHIHDKYGMYMNHSFTPSTYIDNNNVIAYIDIQIGDELTFDYNKNEINMAAPFMADGIYVCGKKNESSSSSSLLSSL